MSDGIEIMFHESTGSAIVRNRFDPVLGNCFLLYLEQQERRRDLRVDSFDSGPRVEPVSRNNHPSGLQRMKRTHCPKRRKFRDFN